MLLFAVIGAVYWCGCGFMINSCGAHAVKNVEQHCISLTFYILFFFAATMPPAVLTHRPTG